MTSSVVGLVLVTVGAGHPAQTWWQVTTLCNMAACLRGKWLWPLVACPIGGACCLVELWCCPHSALVLTFCASGSSLAS
jgi:hypothetical protein